MRTKRKLQLGLGFGFVGLLAPTAGAQTFTEIIKEGDPMFGIPGELVSRIDNVDINNSGDWLIELDTDAATNDHYLVHNGTIIHQEGNHDRHSITRGRHHGLHRGCGRHQRQWRHHDDHARGSYGYYRAVRAHP